MTIVAVKGVPKLHNTPLASIVCNAPEIFIEADDEKESRIRFVFTPYQAVKITTFDCFRLLDGRPIIAQTVMEVQNSLWIDELCKNLKLTDCEARFMNKSKHFLLPLGEDFLEVLAWNIEVQKIEDSVD